ncbi:MAG: oxidoreductase [Planctomycetota bacterium]|nr:oxidoreductase [Planctomycetota bacterium]
MAWTLQDLPSLKNKRIVITGGNSGIGFDTARVCAEKGAELVLACRNLGKADEAAQKIRQLLPKASVTTMALDLSRQKSIRDFAKRFIADYKSLDVLVNNAGIMMPPYELTEDGFESQFGVNHLGHFALTGLLLPVLEAAPSARIVNISSLAHRFGDMNFENPMFEGGVGYSRTKAYGRSKLANLLFTFELKKRLAERGSNVMAVTAHPGLAATNLSRYLETYFFVRWAMPLVQCFIQSADMGALPTLRALGDPGVESGDYFGPDGFRQQRGYPRRVGSSKLSRDPQISSRLWTLSENLTGIRYLGMDSPRVSA